MNPERDAVRGLRRVLRRLAEGARLEKRDDGGYALVGPAGSRGGSPVPAALADLLCARGLLAEANGALVPTEAGEAWLRREEAHEDPYAAQHRILETRRMKDSRGRECYVVVNAAESPLGALYQRGLVSVVQFEAGERLRRDYTTARLSPRLCVDLSAPVGRRSLRPETLLTDTALAAKQRFNRALAAVGPGLADALFDVCCDLKGLEESERARSWPRASMRIVLCIALDRLARHYGMMRRAPRRIRAWSMEEG